MGLLKAFLRLTLTAGVLTVVAGLSPGATFTQTAKLTAGDGAAGD